MEKVSVKGPTMTLFQQSLKMFILPSYLPSLPSLSTLSYPLLPSLSPSPPSLPLSLPSGNRRGTFPEPSVPCSLLGSHPSPHTYCSCSTLCVTSKLTRGRGGREGKSEVEIFLRIWQLSPSENCTTSQAVCSDGKHLVLA